MEHIQVSSLMVSDTCSISVQASLTDVVNVLAGNALSCLVVVDGNVPVGVVTERDAVRLLQILFSGCVVAQLETKDYVSSPPVVINHDATLFEALVITRSRKIRHLPVVDDNGQLVGVITQSEIVKAYFDIIEAQREIIERSIAERTQELVEANEKLQALSLQDSLLGIGNRRAMEVDIRHSHNMAIKYKRPYAVVLIDVDFFKNYNDHYGHPDGDKVLRAIADCVNNTIRRSDRLYRYGGEEFLLLLPETILSDAMSVGRDVVNAVASMNMKHEKSSYGLLTISAGVFAEENFEDVSWEELVEHADKGLYDAKEQGRNQVKVGRG